MQQNDLNGTKKDIVSEQGLILYCSRRYHYSYTHIYIYDVEVEA